MQDLEIRTETNTEAQSGSSTEEHISKIPNFTSIIIPIYNVNYPLFHYTGNCIGSIREHTEKGTYEIILIDNGSPVKPSKLADYKADKIIVNQENKGVAVAWNQGIRIATGEYIVILNNDTMVFDNWLPDLVGALQKADLIMATPMYGEPFSRAVEAAQKRSLWENKSIEESFSEFRDFACFAARKSLFETIGMFDEQFFAYSEDLDFLRRMDQEGLKYFSTRKVNIFHVIGATTTSIPETPDTMNKSKEKLKEKWGE